MQNKIIQLDFDGTITTTNIGLELQRRFAIDSARFECLRRQFELGTMDTVSVVQEGWANVKPDIPGLLRTVLEITTFRRGFSLFGQRCRAAGYARIIVSNGMSFYMEKVIKDLPIIAGQLLVLSDRTIAILPCDLKLEVARLLRPDIYIGDGQTDIEPSTFAQKVYAIKDGKLHHKTNAIPFEDFSEIKLT